MSLIVQINGKLLVPDGVPCVSRLSYQNAVNLSNQNLEMLSSYNDVTALYNLERAGLFVLAVMRSH